MAAAARQLEAAITSTRSPGARTRRQLALAVNGGIQLYAAAGKDGDAPVKTYSPAPRASPASTGQDRSRATASAEVKAAANPQNVRRRAARPRPRCRPPPTRRRTAPLTKIYLWAYDSSKSSPIAAITDATPGDPAEVPAAGRAGQLPPLGTASSTWALTGGCIAVSGRDHGQHRADRIHVRPASSNTPCLGEAHPPPRRRPASTLAINGVDTSTSSPAMPRPSPTSRQSSSRVSAHRLRIAEPTRQPSGQHVPRARVRAGRPRRRDVVQLARRIRDRQRPAQGRPGRRAGSTTGCAAPRSPTCSTTRARAWWWPDHDHVDVVEAARREVKRDVRYVAVRRPPSGRLALLSTS